MLEGYKPIDFSSMAQGTDLSQLRNKAGLSQAAMGILANSQWNETPISTLLASGLNMKGEAPKRKQTLWGRAVDLLSLPAYTVANAADDALAGHQSDDYDSVLKDTGQVIGGIVTGAGRGIGTSLRGAFAGSETAADPQDKIYLGDFLIRYDTHMSAEDALKPENREKVRERLAQKKINAFDDSDEGKYFYDFDTGKVEVSDEDIDDYFKEMNLWGIGASIVSDPLNFVKGPTGIFAAGKGTAEVPQVIRDTKNTYQGFKAAPPSVAKKNSGPITVNPGSMAVGKNPGSYKVNLPPGAIQGRIANPATGELVTPPTWFNFPRTFDDMADYSVTRSTHTTRVGPPANITDDMDDILGRIEMSGHTLAKTSKNATEKFVPVAKVPKEQLAIVRDFKAKDGARVGKLTNDLIRRAITAGPGWADNIRGRLATKYPGVPFPQTSKLIDHLSQYNNIPQRMGNAVERKKLSRALNNTIKADIEALAVPPKIRPAGEVLNEAAQMGPVHLSRLVAKAKGDESAAVVSKNAARNTQIATETFNKWQGKILGDELPGQGIRNPDAYWKSVKSGKTVRYSGVQQVQMWNHITHTLKNVKSPQRFAAANRILKETEELFIARGVRAMSSFRAADSVPLRLSQVLDAIGPAAAAMSTTLLTKILRGDPKALSELPAEVIQKIEDIKAGEALVDGSRVAPVVENISRDISELIKGPLSVARTEEIVTIGSKVAQDIASKAGGSPVAGRVARALTSTGIIPKTPVDTAIKSKALNTTALISHPNGSPALLRRYSSAPAVTRAIRQQIGGPPPSKLGKMLAGAGARVPEWLGARFNAAYKNADMRPIYLKEAASAKSTVARRAEYLNKLAKRYDVNDADLWNDALKGAQGRMEPVPGTPAAELSKEILEIMENLFGSSGLKTSVIADSTVAGRAQLFMRELNANLKRFGLGEYQFTKKGDYAEGAKWLNSWESWKIERPLEFLFKMQNVVEHTVREKIMFDEIAARFGSPVKSGEFTQKVNHARLGDVYFGKDAASQITQFISNLKAISQTSSKPLQLFDQGVSKWKASVTIYIPSHHIRNLIGDMYFNWMAGVNSMRPYGTAMKVMQSQKGRYEGLAEISSLTGPRALEKLMATGTVGTPKAVGKQTALTMRNGQQITNDMVYVSAFQQGILPTTRVLEDIPDDVARGMERFKPFDGRVQKFAHNLSEGRDHYIRLAHYIDYLKKSPKSFEKAVEDAASEVRKWHPDGMDLTAFERGGMRRVFPFYSWTRKALPLVIESMVATPGKVMAIPKANYLLQNALGIQTGPISDPFPYDQLFPDWIREKGIGPMFGESGSYTVVNPGNPTMDITAQLNHPGKMGLSMLNPAARIPFEVASGTDIQTGAPIEDMDYAYKQVPGVSHLGRLTGEFGVSDTTKETSQGYNLQNIANLLTALGIQNTGPYQKSAGFDLREYLRSTNGG
jgi:hypothetical protein